MLPLLLESVLSHLEEISPQKEVVTITEDTTLKEVLQLMAKFKILSVPVTRSSKCIGLLDSLTVCSFLVGKLEQMEGGVQGSRAALQSSQLLDTPARALMDAQHTPTYALLSERATLADIVMQLASVKRVVLADEQGHLVRIVTQTDIARYLVSKMDHLGRLTSNNVRTLGVTLDTRFLKGVVTANYKSTAAEAFQILSRRQVSAVPICDDNGDFVSEIGVADLKALTPDTLDRLYEPATSLVGLQPPVTIDLNATFATLLEKIVSHRVHRLFVKEDDTLVGVISLTDVMNCLVM